MTNPDAPNSPDQTVEVPEETPVEETSSGMSTCTISILRSIGIVLFLSGFGFGFLAGYANGSNDVININVPVPVPVVTTPSNPDEQATTLKILHINDHHSHLSSKSLDIDVSGLNLGILDESNTAITSVSTKYGGFPKLTTIFKEKTAGANNVLKLHAGDAITGTLYYTLHNGKADAQLMNEICFDAFTLGNHEFDHGDSTLANFLDELVTGKCRTPVLGANIFPGPSSKLRGYIQPYTIKTFGPNNEFKVAIIGIDIARKTKDSSSPDAGTTFADETETAQNTINVLKGMNITKIIIMSHYGYTLEQEMVKKLRGVDIVVGADTHALLGTASDMSRLGFSPAGDYPTKVVDADGKMVCIVQAWQYAAAVGELSINFDKNGDVLECSGAPIFPVDGSLTYAFNEATTRTLSDVDTAKVLNAIPTAKVTADNSVAKAILTVFDESVVTLQQEVIATVPTTLCLERFPGQGKSSLDACKGSSSSTFRRGGDISNLVPAAFLHVIKTADFSIQNGGGVRLDVQGPSDFTISNAYRLLPFASTLVTIAMTGQQIINVLEDAVANHIDNADGSTGSYPYCAGIRFNVDASKTKGSRILNTMINSRLAGSWTAISTTTTYSVVTNNYIAGGKDGYLTFGTLTFEDTFTEYAQGFVDYAREKGTLTALPDDQYSTQKYIGTDGCDHSTTTTCTNSY